MTELQRILAEKLPQTDLRFDEPMFRHTSFRIGGPAEVMAFPKTENQLADLMKISSSMHVKPYVLGAGTNILAPDQGLKGLVICLKDCLDGMEQLEDHCIRVMAGVTMSRAAVFASNIGLSGMEFAHGIPGTVGGGVYMNAGAYGGEICQICRNVDVMDPTGKISTKACNCMDFSYRHSILENTDEIVLSAVFSLEPKPVAQIREKMKELMNRRSASQPLNLPSAGSAFKRPASGYAAALIDQAGLKGFRIGDAAISEKHAGFAVNLGNATASDVQQLLQQVSDKVMALSGIRIEPEIRIW